MSASVPIIDLSRPDDAVAGVRDACRDWGVFHLVGHGVDDEFLARIWEETRRFFSLPRAAKRALARTQENPRGYYDRELTKNKRDLKEVFDFGAVPFPELPDEHPRNRAGVDGHNQWPREAPEFAHVMKLYLAECERLGLQILDTFCLGLGLESGRLHRHFAPDHTSFARLNYYPLDDPLDAAASASATPLGDMALHHHTDAGALTILLQDDVGGLQVYHESTWVDVEPLPGGLVVNIGDMTQVWSNDRYPAALHRVLPRTTRERYSIPFFFNPSYDTDYAPLETVIDEGAKYTTLNWGAFRQARTDGDYADVGKEIQIADFRIR